MVLIGVTVHDYIVKIRDRVNVNTLPEMAGKIEDICLRDQ